MRVALTRHRLDLLACFGGAARFHLEVVEPGVLVRSEHRDAAGGERMLPVRCIERPRGRLVLILRPHPCAQTVAALVLAYADTEAIPAIGMRGEARAPVARKRIVESFEQLDLLAFIANFQLVETPTRYVSIEQQARVALTRG